MKLNRRILRKLILQELTLRGGPRGSGEDNDTRKLKSPLAKLPPLPALDLDDKTDVLDDETTDLDWNRPADVYVDDPVEPTDPDGWGDFWMNMSHQNHHT